MENQEIRQNAKLGAFVLGGAFIFLAALFYLGREGNVFNRTFTISAIFKNVEGLKEGDNVWLSGVKIGMVKRVQIISEGKVIVILSLKDKQNEFIKKNATAYVGSDGLVGNKIVIIRPGTEPEIIHDQDTINALSPTDTQELFNIAKEVGVNARSISNDLKLISERLNNGEGFFGELLRDGPVAEDLRLTITSLKRSGANADKLTYDAKILLAEVNNGDGLITKLIKDTLYAQNFQRTLGNLNQVSTNAKAMSEDLQIVIDKMNSGNNAVGVLLADTVFATKLKSTIDNAQSASIKLDNNMEALQHNFLLRGYFKKQKKREAQLTSAKTKQ
ncbi:MAG: MCE family protein [Cyclobacteriaceae bacterium]|nr:MCE family protein [Cyclobacteriaceae bacterium]